MRRNRHRATGRSPRRATERPIRGERYFQVERAAAEKDGIHSDRYVS